MTYTEKLQTRIQEIDSKLCVGLDPRPEKLAGQDITDFLYRVIEETSPYASAFKPNSAYFEAMGWKGMKILEDVCKRIDSKIPIILDFKRGDIGTTQDQYAKAAYEVYGADAVTLSPYMGLDSLLPFLERKDKGAYILGVTSNQGSKDLQLQSLTNDRYLFEEVISLIKEHKNAGLVLGLTSADNNILEKIPDLPLLIPGLGAQGGDLDSLTNSSIPRTQPILINVSRGILFPENNQSFEELAKEFKDRINSAI